MCVYVYRDRQDQSISKTKRKQRIDHTTIPITPKSDLVGRGGGDVREQVQSHVLLGGAPRQEVRRADLLVVGCWGCGGVVGWLVG